MLILRKRPLVINATRKSVRVTWANQKSFTMPGMSREEVA